MDPITSTNQLTLVPGVSDIEGNRETVSITYDALAPDMSDDDFISAVNSQLTRINQYENKLKLTNRREINYKYWYGDQVDRSAMRVDQEKNVENDIFRNIETLIPIVTSRTPELTCTPAYKNTETRKFAMDVKRSLMAEWQVYQYMQQMVSRGIRNHQMNFIGVFKMGYDPEEDAFWTQEIPATNVKISQYGDMIIEYIKDQTVGDVIKMFPAKKKEVLAEFGVIVEGTETKEILDSPIEYLEVWTDELMGWKFKSVTLDLKKNPHFDYTGQDFKIQVPIQNDKANQQQDELDVDPETGQPRQKLETVSKTVMFNHFKKPRKPYLFLTYFNRGVHVYDDTTLIEQGIGPQDWINKRKRQIGMNADSTNGHWVSSGDFISQEEFDKIEGSVDEKIWLESGMPKDGFVKITGDALPQYIYQDLTDSRSALDNIMGTHATTRGDSSNNKTLGQDLLQKDQDFGRVDGYVRDGVEVLAQKWYEYMYHLYLVYRTSKKAIAIPDDADFESDNVIFSRDHVPLVQLENGDLIIVPMLFMVKQGTTLPVDEQAEFVKAKTMKDILSPIDFFKKMGEPNPRELTKNLLMWTNDPFSFFQDDPDIQKMLQKMQTLDSQRIKDMVRATVTADANTPIGAQVLEAQGMLPPGTSAALAQKAAADNKLENLQNMPQSPAAAGMTAQTAAMQQAQGGQPGQPGQPAPQGQSGPSNTPNVDRAAQAAASTTPGATPDGVKAALTQLVANGQGSGTINAGPAAGQ